MADVVDRFLEAFNRGEVPRLSELATPDYTYAEPMFPGPYDAAGHEEVMRQTLAMFPDRRMEVTRRMPGVDGEVLEAVWTGTPAGGDPLTLPLWILADIDPATGLISRFRSYYDPIT